jgi:hypothetical protein
VSSFTGGELVLKRKVKVDEYTCDGCGKVQLVDNHFELLGIIGTAIEHNHTGGGWGGDWFACSRECVAAAVINRLERGDD